MKEPTDLMLTRVSLILAVTALLAVSVQADDGLYAPAERWTHPRGPASGSGRSHARAPRTFGGILWTAKAKGTILAPPVTWDGVAFVLDGDKNRAMLLAVDTRSGKTVSRVAVKSPGGTPQPAVDDRSVLIVEEGRRLVEFRLQNGRLQRRWNFDAGTGASAARVLDGEIYLPTADGLHRLRVGSRRPVWTAPGKFAGEPAVRGDHVYAVISADGKLSLAAYRRADGKYVAGCVLGPDTAGAAPRVAAGSKSIGVRMPLKNSWALVELKAEAGNPSLTFGRVVSSTRDPLAGRALVVLDGSGNWTVQSPSGKQKVWRFTGRAERADLVDGATAPIALRDDVVCFGMWAGNLSANRIHWHLKERADVKVFAQGLRYNPVPAGDRVLLTVPKSGKSLCAIGEEKIG
ncbi:MAG: outer membrane protein assembly factor BamB family protein [Planctomycetota bacterium]